MRIVDLPYRASLGSSTMKRRPASVSKTTAQRNVFSKIMVAVDSPEEDGRPARAAISLASLHGAELLLLHVAVSPIPIIPPLGAGGAMAVGVGYYETPREEERRVSRWMNRVVWQAEECGVKADARSLNADRSVADQIITVAEDEGVDLIITGTGERTTFERIMLGSVSSEVVRNAKCSVLVVR